jgi:RimJ/RimL family protein N-acetyltransferase
MARIESITHQLANGESCVVRSAVESDTAAVIAHLDRLRGSSAFLISQPHDPLPKEDVQRERIVKSLASPTRLILVAQRNCTSGTEPNSNPIIAALEFHGHENERIAHHGSFGIGVDSDMRGNGIGRLMILTLLDWAMGHDSLEKISLGAMTTNLRAIRLYTSIGFVEEYREPRFFKLGPEEYVDDLSMAIYVKEGTAPEGFNTWRGMNVESASDATKDES